MPNSQERIEVTDINIM